MARVLRMNGIVNPSTQTIPVFLEVRGEGLREGMYVKVWLDGRTIDDGFEVSRKLLIDDEKLFVVRDSVLDIQYVEPVYFKERNVIIRGLADGTEILSRAVPGAYKGMSIEVLNRDSLN